MTEDPELWLGDRDAGNLRRKQPSPRPVNIDGLAEDVLKMCLRRGWDLKWNSRGAYLHLEASELIEALRGKRGTVLDEAGDVLLVLMSITQNAGIPFSEVVAQARLKCDGLFERPRYAGEEFTP